MSQDEEVVVSNGNCLSRITTSSADFGSDPMTKTRTCWMYGRDYQFTAKSQPGTDRWALTEVVENEALRRATTSGELPAGRLTPRARAEANSLLIAVAVDTLLVSRLSALPCCQTKRFAPTDAGLVEWWFTIDRSKVPAGLTGLESGQVLFDPAHGWVMQEYRVSEDAKSRGKLVTIRKLTYKAGPGGLPVPDKVRDDVVTTDKSYSWYRDMQFELVTSKPPPDEAFTLNAYGLPEEVVASSP